MKWLDEPFSEKKIARQAHTKNIIFETEKLGTTPVFWGKIVNIRCGNIKVFRFIGRKF